MQGVKDLTTSDGLYTVYNFEEMLHESDSILAFLKGFETFYTSMSHLFKELQADFDAVCHTLGRISTNFNELSHLH